MAYGTIHLETGPSFTVLLALPTIMDHSIKKNGSYFDMDSEKLGGGHLFTSMESYFLSSRRRRCEPVGYRL